MKPEELQAIREQYKPFAKDSQEAEVICELADEVERLTTENTFHSTQLDRAREEIQKLRAFVEWIGYDAPPRWADKAKTCLRNPKNCTCFISDRASLSCPMHGLDAKKGGETA